MFCVNSKKDLQGIIAKFSLMIFGGQKLINSFKLA